MGKFITEERSNLTLKISSTQLVLTRAPPFLPRILGRDPLALAAEAGAEAWLVAEACPAPRLHIHVSTLGVFKKTFRSHQNRCELGSSVATSAIQPEPRARGRRLLPCSPQPKDSSAPPHGRVRKGRQQAAQGPV